MNKQVSKAQHDAVLRATRTGSSVYSAATIFRAKRGSLASKGYRPYSMAYRMTPQLQMSAHCAAALGW